MKKKHILITNDDGVDSLGLYHLWSILKDHYKVSIVAPSYQRSGAGASLTFDKTLQYNRHPWPEDTTCCYRVSGTPVDCVKTALSLILQEPIDMIVSGINHGSNAGRNALYSGTVGACIEGALRNIPSMAVSCVGFHEFNFHEAYRWLIPLVQWQFDHPLPKGCLLNINIPEDAPCHGVRLCQQGRSYWVENPAKEREHEDDCHYQLGGKIAHFEEAEQSDIHALNEGWISAVPMYINDLTLAYYLHQHENVFETIQPIAGDVKIPKLA